MKRDRTSSIRVQPSRPENAGAVRVNGNVFGGERSISGRIQFIIEQRYSVPPVAVAPTDRPYHTLFVAALRYITVM